MAKILVAASPDPRAVVQRILAGHELFYAETMAQAEQFLGEQTFDLILCTIAFDESRMFQLLERAKSAPPRQQIPFVCARVRSHVLIAPTAVEAAAITCRALGADAFLDIADYHVDPEREMREAIQRILAGPERRET